MKTPNLQKSFSAIAAAAVLSLSAMTVAAQDSSAAAQPQLSYGAAQIVQLARAKVSDDTIIAYIHNSGNSYALDADQIIYLRQQGISDAVVSVMLNQPKNAPAAAPVATQQNNSSDTGSAQTSTAVAQPTTTYVQTAPPSTVYVIPDTQTYYYDSYYQPYYYPYYAPYPAVSLSFGLAGDGAAAAGMAVVAVFTAAAGIID
jgi:hypothetical protein